MDELEAVLKYLKNNKSRDPNDHANELFKPNVAGSDLKLALLYLMNRIKDTGEFPEALRTCNITSIFKKGARNSFNNYRGIFRVTIIRSILNRLVYNDIYPVVDSNLTDSNVGSRKGRNVRDNLFVLHATIIQSKKERKKHVILQYMTWKNVSTRCGAKSASMISGMWGAKTTNSTY